MGPIWGTGIKIYGIKCNRQAWYIHKYINDNAIKAGQTKLENETFQNVDVSYLPSHNVRHVKLCVKAAHTNPQTH